ncbi:MAG: SCP2 sterol-binding domain-containing protein [Promethearchaeota archaeon]
MVDMDKVKELQEKIDEGTMDVNDIPDYLTIIVDIANESEDIQEEIEGWDRVFQFKVENGPEAWLSIKDGKFEGGVGTKEDADVTLEMGSDVGAGIFSGEVDATSAYMSGDLKVIGPLPDAVKFRTLTEMVREEIEDMLD